MFCGLKLTHDAAVAVIADGELVGCIESEKVANRRRHARFVDVDDVLAHVDDLGCRIEELDRVAVDGWARYRDGAARVDIGDTTIEVAPYVEGVDCVQGALPHDPPIPFRSYPHAIGHVFAAYCTSPFAAANEPAWILVWDGGMPAHLYRFDPASRALTAHGVVLDITGGVYPVFAAQLATFGGPEQSLRSLADDDDEQALATDNLPISGKAMALAGLGAPDEEVMSILERVTRSMRPTDHARALTWAAVALRRLERLGCPDAVLMASLQEFLLRALHRALAAALEPHASVMLCFGGGCALNIKWNAALRASGLCAALWVPPFPNDAGSAIGVACADMVATTPTTSINWSVFSGPDLGATPKPFDGWTAEPATVADVARRLHEDGEPIVVLHGRAELGPRALGHRSIVAPALDRAMHDTLNTIKQREPYRPVAPICLESRAPEIFAPGTPDPFMLYDHTVRTDWAERIPAVVHTDGTARLQTVGSDNDVLHRLLVEYERLSGVPVLCNTSANFAGCGFFPDAASAMRWGGVSKVWSEGTLYVKR